jgi:hypothetical protein
MKSEFENTGRAASKGQSSSDGRKGTAFEVNIRSHRFARVQEELRQPQTSFDNVLRDLGSRYVEDFKAPNFADLLASSPFSE